MDKEYSWTRQRMLIEIDELQRVKKDNKSLKKRCDSLDSKLDKMNKTLNKILKKL